MMDYTKIINQAIEAGHKAADAVNPEPIGWVIVEANGRKTKFYERGGLCGIGALLLTRKKRKLAQIMKE